MQLPEAIRRVIRLRYLPRLCDTTKLRLPTITVKYSFVEFVPDSVIISRRIRPWKHSHPGRNRRLDEFLDLLYVEQHGVIEWRSSFFCLHDPRDWK